MIKISINGNRSDIAGYISYYSNKEIAPLLGIELEDVVYETAVVDYFSFGDIDLSSKVEAVVTISDDYREYIDEINNILSKYLSGFVSEFTIRYEIVDSNLIYRFKVAPLESEDECNHQECNCEHDECQHDDCDKEHHCHCHHCHDEE